MTENNNNTDQNSQKDWFKNMLCYIPFVAPVLFFVEQNKTPELSKHIKYGIFLLIWFLALNFIFNQVLPFLNLWGIIVLIYLIASWWLWYKAYSWEKFDIEAIDNIEKKVKENIK